MPAAQRNMYGCLPCSECGSNYRYPHTEKDGVQTIVCDDCGSRGAWDGTWGDNGSVDEVTP